MESTISMARHGGGSSMLWGYMVKVYRKMDRA